MISGNQISTNRIEAFSDGVIAIIITVMVFDLKLHEIPAGRTVWSELITLLPKFISYAVSFLMLAIMWVSHHQLFHQIRHADGSLLWYNMLLLFWMSIVPFGTNFIGTNPMLAEASMFYAMIFFMNALSFTLLRNHVVRRDLLLSTISKSGHRRIIQKNRIALLIYLMAAIAGFLSVYIAFVLFLVVPAMYFIPERVTHVSTDPA